MELGMFTQRSKSVETTQRSKSAETAQRSKSAETAQRSKSAETTESSKPSEAQRSPTQAGRGLSASTGERSIISADLNVVGDLHSAGDIQIKGKVEGDIKSRTVTVDEGAHVQGSISADTIQISGSIEGRVEAPTVTVTRTAKMIGDIVHQNLSVEPGAQLEGQCRRLDTKKATERPVVPGLKPVQVEPATTEKKETGTTFRQ
jgi:cytoskeletal protein CcmA (bactofilin family)